MSSPDVGDVHVNQLLTNISVGYKPSGFFAARAFPIISVPNQTGLYAKYNKSYWARDLGAPGAAPTGSYATRRAPGSRARTVDWTVDNTSTYRCVNYALGVEIPRELRANADNVFNLDRDATTLITSLLNLRWDREFVAEFITAAPYGALTISNKWSDTAASTPMEDIRAGLTTLRQKTLGMSAGGGAKILMGALVEQRLMDHPDVLERIKYGGTSGSPAMVTRNLLAQLFGVDEVIVAESVYTSDEEGTAEASVTYADVESDDVLLYWTPPGAQQLAPSAGYLFNWGAAVNGGGNNLTFTRSGEESRDGYSWIEVHAYLDWVATDVSAGVYNADAVD